MLRLNDKGVARREQQHPHCLAVRGAGGGHHGRRLPVSGGLRGAPRFLRVEHGDALVARRSGPGGRRSRSRFTEPSVWRSLWTTLKFAAVSVSAEMVLGIALALALEGNMRGMAFFRSLFILPMMVAPIAVGPHLAVPVRRAVRADQRGPGRARASPPRAGWPRSRWRSRRSSSPTSGSGRRSSSSWSSPGSRMSTAVCSRRRASTARAGGRSPRASSCR